MIEEQQTRFVAAADYTDECRVDVRMRRKHMDISAAQAREFARELVEAAELAESAAESAVRRVEPFAMDMLGDFSVAVGLSPVPETFLHPECVAGKCGNCDGNVLSIDDRWVPCSHHCHTAGATA
jgi:hypothetical protein